MLEYFLIEKIKVKKVDEKRALEIISNEVKDIICNVDVLTPDIFFSVFNKKAEEHGIDKNSEIFKKYSDHKITNLLKIQDETRQKAHKLSETTSKALSAIKEKDDGSLKEVLNEVKLLKKEMNKLKESLYKDELTGAYNRKWLYDHCLDNDSNFQCEGILVIIDLNYFKTINDTYGHIIGDKVLVFIKGQLQKSKANVVRYGGDEFLLIFENKQNIDTVKKQLNQLREEILHKHLKAKETQFRVSFSFGAYLFDKSDNFEKIIEKADEIMYEDKQEIKKRIKGIEV